MPIESIGELVAEVVGETLAASATDSDKKGGCRNVATVILALLAVAGIVAAILLL